jgi:hypothetical protein
MNLGKDFLCDVICIVAIAQDAIADAIDLGCVALDDLTKSRLIANLQSRYQLSVIRFALLRPSLRLARRKRRLYLQTQTWSRTYLPPSLLTPQRGTQGTARGSLALEIGESLAGRHVLLARAGRVTCRVYLTALLLSTR